MLIIHYCHSNYFRPTSLHVLRIVHYCIYNEAQVFQEAKSKYHIIQQGSEHQCTLQTFAQPVRLPNQIVKQAAPLVRDQV